MDGVTRRRLRLGPALLEMWPALLPITSASVGLLDDRGTARMVHGVLLAAMVLLLPLLVRSVRRRMLTCHPGGLVVQMDRERFSVDWDDVVGLRRGRHLLLLGVDELVFSSSHVDPIGSSGRDRPGARSQERGETRVLVGLFDTRWRSGPVGERARAAGLEV